MQTMATQEIRCPYCQWRVKRKGFSQTGAQRYQCLALDCRRTFQLAYAYQAWKPGVKSQIVDMAMNGSGIRDTSRVLHVSPATVIAPLKKRKLH
jgi:transposase-like protein